MLTFFWHWCSTILRSMTTLIPLRPTSLAIVLALLAGPSLLSQDRDAESRLRQTLDHFIAAADKGDTKTIVAMYDREFTNVRVADDGGVVRLTREQVLQIVERAAANTFPTKETKIDHLEVVGDQGFVLLVRIKDLGQGWEP